ncbi:hypothetical protein Hte_000541 [Hypoxylon texense]
MNLDIYKNDRITKPKAYTAIGPGMPVPNTFTAADRSFHRSRRQLIGQILTDRSMHTFEPVMLEQIDVFLKQLLISAQSSRPANMTDRTRRLGTDIAGLLGFGYDLRLQVGDENQFMLTILDAMTPRSNVFFHFFSLRRWVRWISLLFSGEMRLRYMALMEKIVTTRMAEGKHARHDLYSFVADALDAESGGLRQSELWAEANFFLTAAGETTKTVMSALFFYLSRNPKSYNKLAHEIRSAFTNGKDINGAALSGCRYLRACIDETLRMSPPAPGILWREKIVGDSDESPLIIDGHSIPPGTVFGINTYSLHHNEHYFPNSFTFSPERWLSPDAPEAMGLTREAFAAFSIGPRACAGKSMAYLEIGLVLAKTLWYFDFEVASGHLGGIGAGNASLGLGRDRPSEFQLYDVFNSTHDGPYLHFKPRGDFWEDIAERKPSKSGI